jgi:hypothetical protein
LIKNCTIEQPSVDFFTFISEDNPLIPANVRAAGSGEFGDRFVHDLRAKLRTDNEQVSFFVDVALVNPNVTRIGVVSYGKLIELNLSFLKICDKSLIK